MTNNRKGDSMTGISRSLAAVLSLVVLLSAGIVSSAPALVTTPTSPYVTDFSARTLNEAGEDDTVAGDHPFEGVTSFALAGSVLEPVKSVFTELPAGFVANVAVAARCRFEQLRPPSGDTATAVCPAASQVGTLEVTGGSTQPLYNMVPERGYPAELASNFASKPVVLYARLRPRTGQYGVTVASPGITVQARVIGATVLLFGVPSQANGTGGAPMPLMTDPVNCQETKPETKLFVDSWQFPGRLIEDGSSDFGSPDLTDPAWRTAVAPAPPVVGCDSPALASQFAPTIESHPTTEAGSSQADTPSGYTVDLDFPQTNDPTDSSSTFNPSVPGAPPLKNATVTLPAGLAISPSAADGLDGCSDQTSDPSGDQVHYDTTNPVTCPEASKIGSVVTTSPLLAQRDPETDEVIGADPVGGDVYVLKPHPGDLPVGGGQDGTFRVLIDVSSEKYGINVKLPGTVTANRDTGQLTATFLENPQLPVKHLTLKLKPGPRASLANPSTCGTFTTTTDLVPWSTPGTPDAHPSSSFGITEGANGSPCASTPQQRPFAPSMSGGTESSQAGASTPFVLHLTRGDGEQELTGVNLTMPQGFAASLTGIPYCPEAAIAQASAKSAKDEQANPSCSSASQIGTLTTAAGPGSNPYYVNGKAYLAGPYKGGSLSVVFITPAVAGPFDLGNVVVRAAVFINPTTAQVTVKTDPIPQMLDGVPLRLRSIVARIDRPAFTLNPTSCNPMSLTGEALSFSGATVALSSHFQVGGCAGLKFVPKFSVSTVGQSSKANGASLTTKISYPYAGAGAVNLTKVKVVLPKQLPSRLTTLQKACTSAQFDANPAGCPSASFIGHATVHTPLLPVPLTGPAIFVSHGGEAFPSVQVVLQGYGITVDLVGTTLIRGGVTSTTFKTVPDVPFTDFELVLPQGPYSALGANLPAKAKYNFCSQKMVMPTEMIAQNGAAIYQNTKIVATGCKAKALTRAQKLAAALRACKKKHGGKRAACAKAARRQFASASRAGRVSQRRGAASAPPGFVGARRAQGL
jgi:hypothetical protein